MRVLVSGATGVLGRRVVHRLVADGHTVTAVARSAAKEVRLRGDGANPVRLDLFDPVAVAAAAEGQQAVLSLATSIPSFRRAVRPDSWHENDRLRREASTNLVEAALAAGVGRVVQESIALLYDDGGDAWLDEDAPTAPTAPLESALAAERQTERVTGAGGTGVVLRFALFYGHDSAHSGTMVAMARRGLAPTLAGPHGFVSSITTDDAASAVVAALAAPPGVYNVADDEPLRGRALADALARAVRRDRVRVLPAWTAGLLPPQGRHLARSHRVSAARLRDATGWRPAVPSARLGWERVAEAMDRD